MTIQLSVVDLSGIESLAAWKAEMFHLYETFRHLANVTMLEGTSPSPAGVFLITAARAEEPRP